MNLLKRFDDWMIALFARRGWYKQTPCLQGHQGGLWHKDYFQGLRWWPRGWTSRCKGRFSRPPRYLFGNLSFRRDHGLNIKDSDSGDWGEYREEGALRFYPKPVPRPGKRYFAWPFYFAWTFDLFCRWRVLLRLGCRYTEVTNKAGKFDPALSYYTVPAGPALRRLNEACPFCGYRYPEPLPRKPFACWGCSHWLQKGA